jgi:PKD repeat protein
VARPLTVALIALAGLACSDKSMAPPDTGSDGGKLDGLSPLTLEIAVTGCASYDPGAAHCIGSPPLTLSFAPVGSPELNRFVWSFGDGTPTTTERAPSHTFAHPGEYGVTLVGGGSDVGMVTPRHALTVKVVELAAGAPCDIDVQCGAGLSCVCAPGSGCSSAFVRGICSAPCDTTECGAGVCAALAIAPTPDGGTGAPAASCIAWCETSAQCVAGFVCQTLPAVSLATDARWTRGCLPLGALRDVGGPCRNANEILDDRLCATGSCADLGALGVCSAACDEGRPCPEQTACVALADGRQLCLLACGSDADCARDPLLACAAAPLAGDAGGNVSVCAPRGCVGDATCSPSGRCGPNAVCVRR